MNFNPKPSYKPKEFNEKIKHIWFIAGLGLGIVIIIIVIIFGGIR